MSPEGGLEATFRVPDGYGRRIENITGSVRNRALGPLVPRCCAGFRRLSSFRVEPRMRRFPIGSTKSGDSMHVNVDYLTIIDDYSHVLRGSERIGP